MNEVRVAYRRATRVTEGMVSEIARSRAALLLLCLCGCSRVPASELSASIYAFCAEDQLNVGVRIVDASTYAYELEEDERVSIHFRDREASSWYDDWPGREYHYSQMALDTVADADEVITVILERGAEERHEFALLVPAAFTLAPLKDFSEYADTTVEWSPVATDRMRWRFPNAFERVEGPIREDSGELTFPPDVLLRFEELAIDRTRFFELSSQLSSAHAEVSQRRTLSIP